MLVKKERLTLQVSEKTHKILVRVFGKLQSLNGKLRNFDDVIKELIETWMDAKGVMLEE